jgi:hypothetical protein
VVTLSEAIWVGLRGTGVRCCCLSPGPVDTPYFDNNQIDRPPKWAMQSAEAVARAGLRGLRAQRLPRASVPALPPPGLEYPSRTPRAGRPPRRVVCRPTQSMIRKSAVALATMGGLLIRGPLDQGCARSTPSCAIERIQANPNIHPSGPTQWANPDAGARGPKWTLVPHGRGGPSVETMAFAKGVGRFSSQDL